MKAQDRYTMSKLADIDSRPFRIRIFQPVILEYRKGLYSGLGKRYGDRIEVWASDCLGADKSIPLDDIRTDYDHPFIKIGPFLWQRRLSLRGMKKGDVLVVCGEPRQLSSLYFALAAKMRGIRVIWWGHHWSSTSKMWKVRIRLLITKFVSDAFLCYTNTGINFLRKNGFKKRLVFATGNTIDQIPIDRAISHWDCVKLESFRKEKSIEGKPVLLISGVLRPKMKLPELIEAIGRKRLKDHNVVVVIIGDGPERSIVEDVARRVGVTERIIWVGSTRDQEIMAPWFLCAKVYVYPGAIGLSIIHAFSYGLPVVTHSTVESQMPEFEAMEDGRTGLLFKEDSIDDLAEKVCTLLDDDALRNTMGERAYRIAHENYSMDRMIANYCEAIETVAKI